MKKYVKYIAISLIAVLIVGLSAILFSQNSTAAGGSAVVTRENAAIPYGSYYTRVYTVKDGDSVYKMMCYDAWATGPKNGDTGTVYSLDLSGRPDVVAALAMARISYGGGTFYSKDPSAYDNVFGSVGDADRQWTILHLVISQLMLNDSSKQGNLDAQLSAAGISRSQINNYVTAAQASFASIKASNNVSVSVKSFETGRAGYQRLLGWQFDGAPGSAPWSMSKHGLPAADVPVNGPGLGGCKFLLSGDISDFENISEDLLRRAEDGEFGYGDGFKSEDFLAAVEQERGYGFPYLGPIYVTSYNSGEDYDNNHSGGTNHLINDFRALGGKGLPNCSLAHTNMYGDGYYVLEVSAPQGYSTRLYTDENGKLVSGAYGNVKLVGTTGGGHYGIYWVPNTDPKDERPCMVNRNEAFEIEKLVYRADGSQICSWDADRETINEYDPHHPNREKMLIPEAEHNGFLFCQNEEFLNEIMANTAALDSLRNYEGDNGYIDVSGWASANGISSEKVRRYNLQASYTHEMTPGNDFYTKKHGGDSWCNQNFDNKTNVYRTSDYQFNRARSDDGQSIYFAEIYTNPDFDYLPGRTVIRANPSDYKFDVVKTRHTWSEGNATGYLDLYEVSIGSYDGKMNHPDGYKHFETYEGAVNYANNGGSSVHTYPYRNYKNASLKIMKKEDGTGKTLRGATFAIYSDSACTVKAGENKATDAKGECTFDGLQVGKTYYVKELVAPTGHDLDTTVHPVTITKGDGNALELPLNNRPSHFRVEVSKSKPNNEAISVAGATLVGAEYELRAVSGVDKDGKPVAGSNIVDSEGNIIYKPNDVVSRKLTKQVGTNVYAVWDTDAGDVLWPGVYAAYETNAPEGFYIDPDLHQIIVPWKGNVKESIWIGSGSSVEHPIRYGKVYVHKSDAEKIDPQGDATLEKAVYGVYAGETIYKPQVKRDEKVVAYNANQLIATITTDKNGDAEYYSETVNPLYLPGEGEYHYYVKEITPSEGYKLDTTVYDFYLKIEPTKYDENNNPKPVERELNVNEWVDKQAFSVMKIKESANGGSEFDKVPNAGFRAYLLSDMKKAAPDYDFDKADYSDFDFSLVTAIELSNETDKTMLTTDADGLATSIEIPYGTYIVNEEKIPEDLLRIVPFKVVINQDSRTPQGYRIFLDKPFIAKLQINKIDSDTGALVLEGADGTEFKKNQLATFKIWDYQKNDYVKMVKTTYPKTEVIEEFTVSDEGYLNLPETLKVGKYRVDEIHAPTGFVLRESGVDVNVTSNTAYKYDEITGECLIPVDFKDDEQVGRLEVTKKAPTLTKFADGKFVWDERGLGDVEFTLFAAEDIYRQDNQLDAEGNVIKRYTKDDIVAKVTTDASGSAVFDNVYLGKYYLKETGVPEGYTLNKDTYDVEFKYEEQTKDVVVKQQTVYNDRKKVTFDITKVCEDTKVNIAGAEFTLYTVDEIKNYNGSRILSAGDVICTVKSDKNGKVVIDNGLPYGKYLIKETASAPGYLLNDKAEFELDCFADEYKLLDGITVKETFENESIKVKVTKYDITNSEELPGAKLRVTDKDGKVVEEWVSTEETHTVYGIPEGDYTLTETRPADGFATADSIKFNVKVVDGKPVVTVNGELVTEVKMYDKPTKLYISKVEMTANGEKELPGAKLTILDVSGEKPVKVASWTSTEEPHYIEKLKVGKYQLIEDYAPRGYLKAQGIYFYVKDTGEIQSVKMLDEYTPTYISKVDITNEKELPGAKLTLFDENGKVVDEWISEETPHYIEGLSGKYKLREVQAPNGYKIASEIEFTVSDEGPTVVVMKDERIPTPSMHGTLTITTKINDWFKNNYQTDEQGDGYSILLTKEEKPISIIAIIGMIFGGLVLVGGCVATVVVINKKD